MNTSLPTRPRLSERVTLVMTPDDKRRVFETAASRGVTVADLVRDALATAVESHGSQQPMAN